MSLQSILPYIGGSLTESISLEQDHPYLLVSVLSGEGMITSLESSYPIKQGDHLIIPATMKECHLEGDLEMIVSKSNKA